jgi:hypothetical protein
MEGIIDVDGILQIKRGNTMRPQMCPYSNGKRFCGDWCAKFGEPRKIADGKTKLRICDNTVLIFKRFKDKRTTATITTTETTETVTIY